MVKKVEVYKLSDDSSWVARIGGTLMQVKGTSEDGVLAELVREYADELGIDLSIDQNRFGIW